MEVNLYKHVRCPWSEQKARKLILLAGEKIKINGILEVIVVGNAEIKKLNSKYRRKNKITDVLSFAWREDKKIKSEYIGEIYICFPQIVKQAKEYKVTVKDEFARMLVHGILHLAGYDHLTGPQEKKMIGIQEKIVNAFQTR